MTYNPSIPQPSDLLSVSQGAILNNFGSSNTIYGVDHYAFNDTTPNAIASVGPIQYSKGKTRLDQGNQVSTPVTAIQSSQTPIMINNTSIINILDFNGISRAFARLIVGNFSSSGAGRFINSAEILYSQSGPGFGILPLGSNTNNLAISSSGTVLIVTNATGSTLNNVFWTLQFLRIEI